MVRKKHYDLSLEEKLTYLLSTLKDLRLLKDIKDVWWAQFPSIDGPISICDENFAHLISRAYVITEINERSRQYESESNLLQAV